MPPAFVLSQDQTLHKNYFNNFRCLSFLRESTSSISLCDLNYIQIQCKLSGYIALFNFQTTFSFSTDRLSTSLYHLANRSVIFNLAQVWHLSNFIFNFFKLFFISTSAVRLSANCGVRFNISQFWSLSNLLAKFFKIFFNSAFRKLQQLLAAWFLIYHRFLFCQILNSTFFDFFINHRFRKLKLFRRQGFKLPHNDKIANLNFKILWILLFLGLFELFLSLNSPLWRLKRWLFGTP